MSDDVHYALPDALDAVEAEEEEDAVVLVSIADGDGVEELNRLRRCGFRLLQECEAEGFALLVRSPANVSSHDEEKEQQAEPGVSDSVVAKLQDSSQHADDDEDGDDDSEDDDYRGKPTPEPPGDEWDWQGQNLFPLEQKPPIKLPEQSSGALQEEQVTIAATFITVCPRLQSSQAGWRKLRMLLDFLQFGVIKADSKLGTQSARADGVRFIYRVDIQVKPAADSEWLDSCRGVAAWPDATQARELNIQRSRTTGVEISPGDPKNLLKVSGGETYATGVTSFEHEWVSKTNLPEKSLEWSWNLKYWSDGQKFDTANYIKDMMIRSKLKFGERMKNLLPIQPDSVQLSRPNLEAEALWILDASSLDASELAFDIIIKLYPAIIRQDLFWTRCYKIGYKKGAQVSEHIEEVKWRIVAPLTYGVADHKTE